MAKNTKYKSDLDQFLDSLKTPEEEKKMAALRATWWDKNPNVVNEMGAKSDEISRSRYAYYGINGKS